MYVCIYVCMLGIVSVMKEKDIAIFGIGVSCAAGVSFGDGVSLRVWVMGLVWGSS